MRVLISLTVLLTACGGLDYRAPEAPPPIAETSDLDREGYDHIAENPFLDPQSAPLSTFAIDVDTAAYANVRRFLIGQEKRPPADAVRIEELVNYFDYAYPEPADDAHPFAVHAEVSSAPWNPANRLVHIGLQGRRMEARDLPPANLVFLLDVSGSMNSANKLPLVKKALALLTEQLRPRDRVAIAVYAGAAGLVLPSTPGNERATILAALEALQSGGSTAGAAGIRLAYRTAREHFVEGGNNRVILATDGDFNVGVSSDGALVRLIEKERESGVFLTVLGFGAGNYQDAKMEKLSNAGNGQAAYIDSVLEARKVLVEEIGGTLTTIAKDVKVQVEFNPSHVKAWRLIGYENRLLRARDFDDDRKDAGELGAGHSVTALYEIVPAAASEPVASVGPLRYQRATTTPAADSGELMTVKLRYKQPEGDRSTLLTGVVRDAGLALEQASEAFRFSSAVAELGLLLCDSRHKAGASYDALIERAGRALGDDRRGYRRGFIELAKAAKRLHN